MSVWKSESRPGRQTAVAVGCVLAGLLLAIGFREFQGAGTNALAGFLLGMLLLAIGIAGFLAGGRQTVSIDPDRRLIVVEDHGTFGAQRRTIPFRDLEDIGIGFLGTRSDGARCYYLDLKLRDDTRYPLFAPGRFFPGSSDRAIVEGWRQRLQRYLVADRDH